MTTIAKLNYRRKQAGLPLMRFDLVKLNPEDVQDLRDAYAAMYEISEIAIGDRRGYMALARGHGYDQDLCHDDDRVFLTWHRSYVYSFEKALNTALQWKRDDDELELTLPFWDWTQARNDTHAPNGLPKILDEADYVNAAGETVPNPLFAAPSLYRALSQGLTGPDVFTQRFPDRLRNDIPMLKDEVDRYMDNPNFMVFQQDFNFGAHGAIHVDVGGRGAASPLPGQAGDMSRVLSAAYDPLFWLHHSMVDKVWADWQELHPNANVPDHVLDTVVFDGRIGGDLINHEAELRYIYTNDSVEAADAATGTVDGGVTGPLSAAATPCKEIRLGLVEAGFARAQIEFLQLRPPKDSYEIRAYIENPHCTEETGYEDDSFAGRLFLFGHGQCHGAPGHCNPALAARDAYDRRAKHPLRYRHTRYTIDCTRGLRRYIGRKHTVPELNLYLLVLDESGQVMPPETVRYAGCALRTYAKT
ncbi:tyrosinase family protein [Vannielia litorea]|uniref:tyrosinase family protein n=1 Tax=Vannielia litorea TaxID=1217970 RepID=UPI001BCC68E1|nr:tyrosinase family protein [Vannielia litorea]MBS8226211.1 tyrosinase family protein [Vannielia litorea]